MQLLQAGLKPVQKRGLCYQGSNSMGLPGLPALGMRDGACNDFVFASEVVEVAGGRKCEGLCSRIEYMGTR